MLLTIKTIALFVAIILLVPTIFFMLVAVVGKLFATSIDKKSLISKLRKR